jgi:PIN domain nuclease of toxin-antitoxin system
MKLLLDTHIWIWSHAAPERLGPKLSTALSRPGTEIWISPISVWEFLLLDAEAWLDAAWSSAALREAPLTREVARRSRAVTLSHQDPADRFLAATAQVYDLTLVTDDKHLLKGRGFARMPNR